MKKALPYLIGLSFVVYSQLGNRFYFPWEKSKVKKEIRELQSQMSEGSFSCKNTQKCLYVYLAPWCGACKQFLRDFYPHILPLVENYHQKGIFGVEMVIGMDQKEKIEQMAKENNFSNFLDDSSKKYQNLFKIKVVPTFIATDSSGKIINSMDGLRARGDSIETASHNFLKDILNL